MKIREANRLTVLPPYLFAEIDRLKKKVIESGKEIISLGIGDPDTPTPDYIINRAKIGLNNPANHQYPSYRGMPTFREAVCKWYNSRFHVELDSVSETIALIGSKEGIAHLPLAFIEKGDVVLVPDPAYPVYKIATIFAGGTPYLMPLLEENNYLPDLDAIPSRIRKKAKLIFLNYPNNPTSACASKEFFKKAVEFAEKNNIAVCHDAAYTEMYYNNAVQPSFLEVDGAKEVGIEFHSLSKTFNMTGWRVACVSGNKDLISGLGKIKENIDSGVFQALQVAGSEALLHDMSAVKELRDMYQERRDLFTSGLDELGWKYLKPKATFYIWAKNPAGLSSADTSMKILNQAGVVVTPGNGFGKYGEGYVRFALTVGKDKLVEALDKLSHVEF